MYKSIPEVSEKQTWDKSLAGPILSDCSLWQTVSTAFHAERQLAPIYHEGSTAGQSWRLYSSLSQL